MHGWQTFDQNQTGISLLGFVVVLAISAILLSFSWSYFTGTLGRATEATAQRKLFAALQTAQNMALSSGGVLLSVKKGSIALHTPSQALTFRLPVQATVLLNGSTFSCLWLNGYGLPATNAECALPAGVASTQAPIFTVRMEGKNAVPPAP